MFLLVSGRHVGAHLDGHHCTSMAHVSSEISIDLGQKIIWIFRLRKTAVNWILARVFEYLPSLFSQILDLLYWTVSIFILIRRDTEHQEFKARFSSKARQTDGKGTIHSLDHFWKHTVFFFEK